MYSNPYEQSTNPQLDIDDPHCDMSAPRFRVAIVYVETAPTATAVAMTAGQTPLGYKVLMNPMQRASAIVNMLTRRNGRLRRRSTFVHVMTHVMVETSIETRGMVAVAQRLLSQNCTGITSVKKRMDARVTASWIARIPYTRAVDENH